jgi:hypothetical protein
MLSLEGGGSTCVVVSAANPHAAFLPAAGVGVFPLTASESAPLVMAMVNGRLCCRLSAVIALLTL